ncbi:MAG: DUF5056 domain-containing protein [Prevotella sp.]|nr:DUF5056 domain-containing protein [Prevotella sp.]
MMTKEEIKPTLDASDEHLLERFFSEASQQTIADNGFTQRVMRSLPDRSMLLSRLWTALCTVAGIGLFVGYKGWQPILTAIRSLVNTPLTDVHPIPVFIAVGAICSILLLELAHQEEITASV